MGLEAFNNLPPEKVRKAQREGNTEALSRMGRKGAQKAKENRLLREDAESLWEEREADKFQANIVETMENANEDILSPDGDEVELDT